MQVSDSSSRILAGLLEARTGQQLTMNRRWRIETALASLLRERGIATLDELITILVMGREPAARYVAAGAGGVSPCRVAWIEQNEGRTVLQWWTTGGREIA